jgi:uncharacterized protein (TIGR00730 family)
MQENKEAPAPTKKIVNKPDKFLGLTPFTLHQIEEENRKRQSLINDEISRGFELIKNQPKSVTFFGSARFSEDHEYYLKARRLAHNLAQRGYAIVSGGGPGIMEASNRGAFEVNGRSIGFTIELPHEQNRNPYITDSTDFYYFFTRKVMLTFAAEAYLVFPGGFGTLNEVSEILTLVQTHKIESVPIILVGRDFWQPFYKYCSETFLKKYATIDEQDMNIFSITDDEDEIIKIIENTPVRSGVRLPADWPMKDVV